MKPGTLEKMPSWVTDIYNLPFSFHPAEDRYLVLPDLTNTKSLFKSGEKDESVTHSGIIIAAGIGVQSPTTGERMVMDFKVGDRVVYGKYTGDDLLISPGPEHNLIPFTGTVLPEHLLIRIIRQGGILLSIS